MRLDTKVLFLGLCCILLISSAGADDGKARAIMERVDARDDGKSLVQDMLMVLIDSSGHQRIRDIKSYAMDVGKDEYTIMFFKDPADVKGTAFLTYDYDDEAKDDDQWLYLPALKKVKRIPSTDKSSSFMGSDFSYFDLTDRDLDSYSYKMLKEIKVRGNDAWLIEAIPNDEAVIKKSGYVKSVAIIRKDNHVIVRAINYMENGKKKFFDVTKLHEEAGVWLIDEMTMTTKKGDNVLHKTLIVFNNIQLNRSIDETMFTTRRLEHGL